MTRKQYAVHTVRDEPARLQDHLDHIAAEGGRVVSVIWQPARQVTLEPGLQPHEVASGYLFPSLSCKGRPLSGPIKRSPPSRAPLSGSKRWRPSAPSSRGGNGFSEGPDEAGQT